MEDRELLAMLANMKGPAVLATVVRTKGSTPRKTGAKMLVGEEGVIAGTVGGGCGEGEVIAAAQGLFSGGPPVTVRVDLTEDLMSWSPAVCGGVMEVFVERATGDPDLTPADARWIGRDGDSDSDDDKAPVVEEEKAPGT